ncbi:hypothetical protein TIFTF001_009427 [Ficus carica]|uniref:phosphopyruvate hydratase n=1 Tax=Ficus carica TaxID=3494 RepID=A0AA87ZV97_FICCA|nr:hypothetical protein TIFTF001_009427 [Ficus carica]
MKEALELVNTAINDTGHTGKEENNENEGDDFKEALKSFASEYHVASILDPFGRDDLELYSKLTSESLESAIEKKTGNALLLKMNQIGSVSECIAAVEMTKLAGWTCILATYGCRRGETEETSVADLSVGLAVVGSGQDWNSY